MPEETEWGVIRFTYNKPQCERIYWYLDHNKDNVVRVFDCIWNDHTFDERDHPEIILELIDRINKTKQYIGRNFERVWSHMHPETLEISICQPKP